MANSGAPLDFAMKQLIRYRDLLANFSRRNKELFFKPGKASSLSLSVDLPPKRGERAQKVDENSLSLDEGDAQAGEREFSFSPLSMASPEAKRMLETTRLDLTEHFGLVERPNRTVESRLEKIRAADSRYQKEFGISGAWLLGPFLLWRDSATHSVDEIYISPIFKLAIDISRPNRARWQMVVEDSALRVNPSLQLAISKRLGVNLPEEIESLSFIDGVRQIAELLASHGRQVSVLSAAGELHRYHDGRRIESTSDNQPKDKIWNALESICTEQAGLQGVRGPELPRLLSKMVAERDEEGNVVERRPVSIDQDLPEAERRYYEATTFDHCVIVDSFFIDHISATRMPLFRDYEQAFGELAGHPIIAELFGQGTLPTKAEKAKLPRELDSYRERENFFVIPTDSSQHGAIKLSNSSSAIVIQGPPGTGKSQTITNLIADKIANGKKVLFVAEKRAALDVVYTRLKQAGIDKQAVLIHSSETNRNELYASFLDLADSKPKDDDKEAWERVGNRLDRVKAAINEYYDAAAMEFAHTKLTVTEVLALHAANCSTHSDDSVEIGRLLAAKITGPDLDEVVEGFNQLQKLVSTLGDYERHPWKDKRADFVVTASVRSDFDGLCARCADLSRRISDLEGQARAVFAARSLLSLTNAEVEDLVTFASCLVSEPTGVDVWAITSRLASQGGDSAALEFERSLQAQVAELSEAWPSYAKFRSDADSELIEELITYTKVPRSIFAPITPGFWRAKRILRAVATPEGAASISLRSVDTRPFKAFKVYEQGAARLLTMLGDAGESGAQEKAWDKLQARLSVRLGAIERARTIFKIAAMLSPQDKGLPLLGTAAAVESFIESVGNYVAAAVERRKLCFEIDGVLGNVQKFFDEPLKLSGERASEANEFLKTLRDRLSDCELIERVEHICRSFGDRYSIDGFRKAVLPQLLRRSESWGERVRKEIARIWYDEVRTSHLPVRGFDRGHFEGSIEDFKKVELSHYEAAQAAVNDQFARRWTANAPDSAALALLKKEAAKQRRVLYPREVMEKGALDTMLRLKPCWLMSPLSVSQILPLVRGMFDVIVFDEASQVRVEDAIPAIFRATTMVVVGDPKQMPPTNFFLGGAEDEDDEDDDETLAESVLDLASRVYPAQMLEWHYRSRSDALIAFSNRAFYGGRLIAPPGAQTLGQDGTLQFVRVEDAYFTQRSGNPMEAAKVIESLAGLLDEDPDRSIGIIAMGQSQRAALEEALEQRMASDRAFANAVKTAESRTEGDAQVGFFIKNLENVQGDERDVILISVGYAPAKPGKKLYLNFGPLSKTGGSRRLNVAVTRARSKIVVFSSFNPEDIPTDEAAFVANPDTTCFGRYLKYVRAISDGQVDYARTILDNFGVGGVQTKRKSSGFARDVARRLRESGYEVSLEVGSSGFFVDVAVHHPAIPGNFVMGIECDGAIFHSTAYARDRDKAREKLLTDRGWKIIRVWGPDWSRSWKLELERLSAAIDMALAGAPRQKTGLLK